MSEQKTEQNNTMIPKARFDEVIAERNTVKERLAEMEEKLKGFLDKEKEEEIRKKQEEGKYQEIIEGLKAELEKVKPLAEEYKTFQEQRRSQLIEKLPEDLRKFANPLSLQDLEEFVAVNTKADSKEKPPRPGARKSEEKPFDWKSASPEERKAWIASKTQPQS